MTFYENMIQLNELMQTGLSQAQEWQKKKKYPQRAKKIFLNIGKVNACAMELWTEHSNDPEFQLFQFEGIDVATDLTAEEESSVSLEEATYINRQNTALDPSPTFAKTASFENTVSFGFKEGLKVGASAEIGFDVGVVNASMSVNTELNFEANQQLTKKNTLSSTSKVPVPVPPNSVVKATFRIDRVKFSGTYTARLRMSAFHPLLNAKMGESFEKAFPGVNLVVTQKGTVRGVIGHNWQTEIGAPESLPLEK